jgi:hypothetical protein
VVFRATALVVPLTALPIVVRLPPTLLSTATDFLLAVVQVRLTHTPPAWQQAVQQPQSTAVPRHAVKRSAGSGDHPHAVVM